MTEGMKGREREKPGRCETEGERGGAETEGGGGQGKKESRSRGKEGGEK